MRLGICLYKLGRGDYNSSLGELAGIAEPTVCTLIKEVCKPIIEEMSHDQMGSLYFIWSALFTFTRLFVFFCLPGRISTFHLRSLRCHNNFQVPFLQLIARAFDSKKDIACAMIGRGEVAKRSRGHDQHQIPNNEKYAQCSYLQVVFKNAIKRYHTMINYLFSKFETL